MTKNLFLGAALVIGMAGASSAQTPGPTETTIIGVGGAAIVVTLLLGDKSTSSTNNTVQN